MPIWSDLYKIFDFSSKPDPLSERKSSSQTTGAGVSQPDAIPDIRQDGSYWGGGGKGFIRLRDTNDFVDLSTVSNRQSRYREYERLRNVAEIETAMTIFADEACVTGSTKVATLHKGLVSIKKLAEETEPFLVYCWDFKKNDYTLGWAYDARRVKTEKIVEVVLDDGSTIRCTRDHRILKRDATWSQAGDLKFGDKLMPFLRVPPTDKRKEKVIHNQFPRIFTFDGWKHEREFIEEWKTGVVSERAKYINTAIKGAMKLTQLKLAKFMKSDVITIKARLKKDGWTFKEIMKLRKENDFRQVIDVRITDQYEEVYDLSVKEHENFCGESVIFHNCQRGENGHIATVECKNEEVKKEVESLMFDRQRLNLDKTIWNITKGTLIMGDTFLELIIDPDKPELGLLKIANLPPDSVYRVETTKGKLVEFQQSKEGPDYQSLTRAPMGQATDADIMQSTAIRFHPTQIVHIRIGDDRKTFYPYGQSLIEPARGPAHQLRLMEDAMIVYRLVRAPERRVFYIDVGQMNPTRSEAFIARLKDQFRKKKVSASRGQGASSVEERWHPPAADEDYWLPIRANSNTRIDTLPGAQNLGEIDDAVYFRNKLFVALNFPKNYFSSEDMQVTRASLSVQNVQFARMIERLQSHIEDGLMQMVEFHLYKMGFPQESYEDIKIKLTPPSEWREQQRAELISGRVNNANALKSSLLYSDFDILTKIMKHGENEAKEMLSRLSLQKLKELKMQIVAQNPQLIGVGVPAEDETEIGAESGGPNPMLAPDNAPPPEGGQAPEGVATPPQEGQPTGQPNAQPLPDPTGEELKKYDLQIQTYSREQDVEDIDYSSQER